MYEDPTALRWCVASMGIIGLLLAVASGCWLCERRLPQRMFAKFMSLSPLAKVVSVVALALSTWFGGAKPGGGGSGDPEDPPPPMMSGCHGGTVLLSPGGDDQPSVVTNRLYVVRFEVEGDARELDLGLAWTDDFWDLLDGNRTVDVFMSTNLVERRWTRILNRSMPYSTNAHDFVVGRYDVDYDFRDWFEGAFADKAFFRFGTRFDGDGDGLTDAEEEFVYGTSPALADTDFDGLTDYYECRRYATDPRNPDSDGDGLWDGEEDRQGSDPLLADSDADGLADAEETDSCRSYALPLWFDGECRTEILCAPSEIVQDEVWRLTLSNAVQLAGRAYSNLVVDVNGVMYLSQNAIEVPSNPSPQRLWYTGWNRGEIAIAPFWSDLVLRPSQGARVSLKTFAGGDSVVEFLNVGFSDPDYADRTVSFQVVFSPSATNRVIVAYRGADRNVFNYASPSPQCGFRVDNGLYADGRYEELSVDSGDSYHILRFGYGTDCNNPDSDGDLVSDYDELFVYHTDPTRWTDSDGDGISDGRELFELHTDPLMADTDGDGVDDDVEIRDGFDPLVDESELDSDGDGLLDFDEEYEYRTDRFKTDTDGDGLDDYGELFEHQTNPRSRDSDNDGLSDFDEVETYGTDPWHGDSDADGLPDVWEVAHVLNPQSNEGDDGAAGDPDEDGIANLREYGLGTDPRSDDSDGDGLRDDEEAGVFVRIPGSAVAFDCSGGTNLLSGSADFDDEEFVVPLPFPVTVAGLTATSMVVSVNGVVGLISTNAQGRTWNVGRGNADFAGGAVDAHHVTVAAYWDDLKAYAARDASVRVADIGTGTDRRCVVEYGNVGFVGDGPSSANLATFQIVIPSVVTNGICVQYLRMDGAFDGSDATVGMQAADRMAIPVSYNQAGCPLAGERIVFRAGTGTAPTVADTDGDGLDDGAEVAAGTSPFLTDTDGDGMNDGWEVRYGFDPRVAAAADGDADGDGVSNLEESRHGSDPHSQDTDGDGLSDGVEVGLGTSLTDADTDGDGLDDGYEYAADLDPCHPYTDRDGLPDGWEVEHGLDPDCDAGDDGADGDPDRDGLSNIDEYLNGCDPQKPDTDMDEVNDGVEVGQGSDPTDDSDLGVAPPAEAFRELVFNIYGDYAAWEMTVEGLGPEDRRTRKISMGAPQAARNVALKMRKGNSYRLMMRWLNCDGHHDRQAPWYCWQALIDGFPEQKSFDDDHREGYCVRIPQSNNIVVGNGWIAENEDGLLTSHVHASQRNSDGGSGAGNVAQGLVATLYVLDDPRLTPDYDGDGKIDAYDETFVEQGVVFRFWTNDDNDAASPNGDVARGSTDDFPVNGLDWSNGHVDGRRDLVDFTPILADVSPVVRNLSPAIRGKLTFRLRHAEGAFNAVWTDLVPGQANAFQTSVRSSGFGSELADAPQNAATERVKPSGTKLPEDFAARARTAQGVFLVEGRQTSSSPLWLETVCDGRIVCSNKVETSLSCVEAMYRWLGLRHVCGDADMPGLTTGEPPNLPDVETTGPHYVFVHGYSVDAQSARGWAAEVFKRLWQSGSRSKFTAVDWFGNYSQFAGVSPNYYQNVVHAFATAPALKAACDALPGEKVMLAHSLGNMLVSEAITHCGLQYSKYYMLNAAVPVEAFNAEARAQDNMKPLAWQRYSDDLFACNWYDKFSATDGRSVLTWRGIFAGIHDAVNCYSPTEDVLGNAPVDGAGGAWSAQELLKGTGVMYLLPRVRREGGWGFNPVHTVPLSQNGELLKTEYTDEEMVTSPPFLPFAEDWLHATNAVTAAQVAEVRDRILADGIPAQTFAAGANAVDVFGDAGNYNMDSIRNDRWPSNRDGWFHSDLKNVAFWYTYKLFQKIVKGE